MFLLLCAACNRHHSAPVICVIPRQSSDPPWVNEHVGANEAASKYKVSVYWNGPSDEDSVEQQVDIASRAIKDRDVGLILSPSNPFALNTVVQRSVQSGMAVVVLGNPLSLKPMGQLSFILNDERAMGELAAERLQKILNDKGEVLLLGADPISWGHPYRSSEFESSLARAHSEIRVADRLQGMLSFGQAEQAAEQAIQKNPHLSAILAFTASATLGAVAATETTHTSNRIVIVGCEYDQAVLYLLRQGRVNAVIAENMRAMGKMAVDAVMKESQRVPVAPYTYVKPALITKENIDDDDIQWMLYLDWRPQG